MKFLIAFILIFTNSQASEFITCDAKFWGLKYDTNIKQRWISNQSTLYINTNSFKKNGVYDSSIRRMAQEWSNVKGSKFKFNIAYSNKTSISNYNTTSDVYATKSLPSNILGRMVPFYTCIPSFWDWDSWSFKKAEGALLGTDIMLNANVPWSTVNNSNILDSDDNNLDLVLLHEMGHSFGLDHNNKTMATMNEKYPNAGPVGLLNRIIPHADDRNGLRILYGDGKKTRHVAASKFQQEKGNPKAVVYNTILNPNNSNESITELKKGKDYLIQYTIENYSTQKERVIVTFYLSPSKFFMLDNNKVKLDKIYMALSPGSVTLNNRVTIPNYTRLESNKEYFVVYSVKLESGEDTESALDSSVTLHDKITIAP